MAVKAALMTVTVKNRSIRDTKLEKEQIGGHYKESGPELTN